jgi:hypothetical protein
MHGDTLFEQSDNARQKLANIGPDRPIPAAALDVQVNLVLFRGIPEIEIEVTKKFCSEVAEGRSGLGVA